MRTVIVAVLFAVSLFVAACGEQNPVAPSAVPSSVTPTDENTRGIYWSEERLNGIYWSE